MIQVDSPNNAAYAASKYAVRGLFRDLRPLFAWRGHRVNSVAPWLTRTPMTDGTKGGGAPDVVGLFERVGCPVAMSTEWAVRACMLVEEGEGLNGESRNPQVLVVHFFCLVGWQACVERLADDFFARRTRVGGGPGPGV